MINQTDILKFLAEQKLFFQQEFQIIKIGLFGSYARGEQSDKSDIDLIVEFAPNTSELSEKKAQLKSILKKRFNKDVDVCREKYIKPYFKKQILNSTIYV